MKKTRHPRLGLVLAAAFAASPTLAATYYVSGSGDNANDGSSETKAFRDIQVAADLTAPGDTVLVMNGVYAQPDPGTNIVNIDRSGTAQAWITYRAYPGHKPKLQARNWGGIIVDGASYIVIDGFEVEGNQSEITYEYAYEQRNNTNNPLTSGNCMGITAKYGAVPPVYARYVRVLNNKVHDCPGGGIFTYSADYVTIAGNEVYRNGFYAPYGNSGISIYQSWNSDTNTGYKMFIQRNVTWGNNNQIPFYAVGFITDGNGIIIDDGRNTQNGSTLGAYNGRTLVENNISRDNGGRGIHVFQSDHVDIVNNTTYRNSWNEAIPEGEISAFNASDVVAVNNIIVASDGRPGNSIGDATNVRFDYNLVFNATAFTSTEAHNIIGRDPLFIDEAGRNFLPQAASPAVNAAGRNPAAKTDIRGLPRPRRAGIDIGAYERQRQDP